MKEIPPRPLGLPTVGDPWGDFLEARARVIATLAQQGKTDKEIAEALSMYDVLQVQLIRMTVQERLR